LSCIWKCSAPSRKNGRFSGPREHEVRGDAPARREARLELAVRVLEAPARELLALLRGEAGQRGVELDVPAGCGPCEALELRDLALVAGLVPVPRHERHAVVEVPRVLASEPDSPDLLPLTPLEPERTERNGDLHDVALVSDAALGVPYGVPGGVSPAHAVRVERVALNAERVDEEHVTPALVVERVEGERQPVVVEHVVAVGDVGADRGGIGVIRPEGDVEVRPAGCEQDLRSYLRLDVLPRVRFVAELEDQSVLPDGVVQHAVDPDGGSDLGDLVRRRFRAGPERVRIRDSGEG
jgi:hypothetical protein